MDQYGQDDHGIWKWLIAILIVCFVTILATAVTKAGAKTAVTVAQAHERPAAW